MKEDKEIRIEVVGNAYVLGLSVYDDATGLTLATGKKVVVLDTVEDAALGKAIRDLLRTRIRSPRKAKRGEEVTA